MKYAIIEEDLGFFLGSYEKYGIFAKTYALGLYKAYGFDTERDAKKFINRSLGKDRGEWLVVSIDTEDKYIDVVDLVKSGYGDYTHNMIDNIPMTNFQVH